MKYFLSTFSLLLSLGLTGCGIGGYWMNGNPNHSPTYPYGAHWIKDGMTRESRRVDSWACGAAKTVIGADHPVFPDDELKAAKLPSDLNDILAIGRVTDKWAICMQAKGYTRIGKCDARCMYP
jgi:hypothetical protein